MKYLSFLLLLFLFSCSSQSYFQSVSPESTGISSKHILEFIETVEKELDAIHGIVIIRNGKMITKGWWDPYKEENLHVLYSLSKSFCSTAIGFAYDEGLLKLEDKVISFFPNDLPAKQSENLKNMTVRDLLIMGTGNHEDTLLAILKSDNWVREFLAQPVQHKPGTYFKYNTGATYMLSAILQKVTGETLVEYLEPRLFAPLGIDDYSWEQDPQGINTGGYGLKVKTEAIAKFGQLYLQKGMWEGKRLLSEKWIEMATSKQIENGKNPNSDWNQGYGFQFWRSRYGAYRGDGAFGQYCLILPEQNTVIAVNGGMKNMGKFPAFVWEKLLPNMNKQALPEAPEDLAKLNEKMAKLQLSPVKRYSSPAPGLIGRKYVFDENEKGLESVTFRQQGEQTFLELENVHGLQYIFFTKGQWIHDEIIFEKNIYEAVGKTNGHQKIACSGDWQNSKHLKVVMYMNETPYRLTFDFKFDGSELTLNLNYNVFFGKKDYQFTASAK